MRAERSLPGVSARVLPRGLRAGSLAALVTAALGVVGCASVSSTADDPLREAQREGLVYWLPKRDIKITVTVDENSVASVVAGSGDMEPDYSKKKFVLNYSTNLIGTNALDVTVNEKGLLGAVVSETTVKLNEVLQEIAKFAPSARTTQPAIAACPRGTYQRLIPAEDKKKDSLCGYEISVTRLDTRPSAAEDPTFYSDSGRSGIYYRQQLPYRVEITPPLTANNTRQDRRDFLVFSPSESPVYFLPVKRTLFSNNKADFAFTEGVPTMYNQSTDGELIGLLKLPANVIGAYFGAIGEIFTYKKKAVDSQQQYLDSQAKMAVEIVKFQACKEAVNIGKTGEELNAACGLK